MKISLNPNVAGLTAVSIFGFSFMVSNIAISRISDPMQILSYRFLTAFAILTILKKLGAVEIRKTGFDKDVLLLVLLQPILYFIFEIYGIKYSGTMQSGIAMACIPVMTGFFASWILKEKNTLIQKAAIGVSFIGIVLTNLEISGSAGGRAYLGPILLFLAVISASLFGVFSRKISQKYSSLEITYFMMKSGAIFFTGTALIKAFFSGNGERYFTDLADPKVIMAIIYLGIFSSIIAFFMINFAFKHLTASRASSYNNLSTVISIFTGVFFFSEKLTVLKVIGVILIMFGVFVLNNSEKFLKNKPKTA